MWVVSIQWVERLEAKTEFSWKENSASRQHQIAWVSNLIDWSINIRHAYLYVYVYTHMGFLVAQTAKSLPAMQETWVGSLGQEDCLEKEMATHSNILAWKTPWTEEPGGLQSAGLQRVRHDLPTSLSRTHMYACMYVCTHTFICVCVCICVGIYVYIHISIYLYIWPKTGLTYNF